MQVESGNMSLGYSQAKLRRLIQILWYFIACKQSSAPLESFGTPFVQANHFISLPSAEFVLVHIYLMSIRKSGMKMDHRMCQREYSDRKQFIYFLYVIIFIVLSSYFTKMLFLRSFYPYEKRITNPSNTRKLDLVDLAFLLSKLVQ